MKSHLPNRKGIPFQPDPKPPEGKGWCLTGEILAKGLVVPKVLRLPAKSSRQSRRDR